MMLDAIRGVDPADTAVFVGPYIFFGYRQIMYYLPEYRVYQVDVRSLPGGEKRKIFWGINRRTFLSEGILLPEAVDSFIIPLIADDRNTVAEAAGVSISNLDKTSIVLAKGPISLIGNIYPELKIRFSYDRQK